DDDLRRRGIGVEYRETRELHAVQIDVRARAAREGIRDLIDVVAAVADRQGAAQHATAAGALAEDDATAGNRNARAAHGVHTADEGRAAGVAACNRIEGGGGIVERGLKVQGPSAGLDAAARRSEAQRATYRRAGADRAIESADAVARRTTGKCGAKVGIATYTDHQRAPGHLDRADVLHPVSADEIGLTGRIDECLERQPTGRVGPRPDTGRRSVGGGARSVRSTQTAAATTCCSQRQRHNTQ